MKRINVNEISRGIWTVSKLRALKEPVEIELTAINKDGSKEIAVRQIDFDDLIRKCEWAVDKFIKNGKMSVIGNMFNRILWTLEVTTAATDGIRVFFNPIFANELITKGGTNYKKEFDASPEAAKGARWNPLDFRTFKLFLFVITHEIYHQLYRHIEQAQRKEETANGKNHILANWSMDDEINRDIEIQWPEFKGATLESDGCYEADKYPTEIWGQIFDDKYKNGDTIKPGEQVIPPPQGPEEPQGGGGSGPEQETKEHEAPQSYVDGWEKALADIKAGKIDPNNFTPLAVDPSNFDHKVLDPNSMMYMNYGVHESVMANNSFNQDEFNQGYNDCIQTWINNQKQKGQGGSGGGGIKFKNLEQPPSPSGQGEGNGSGGQGSGQNDNNPQNSKNSNNPNGTGGQGQNGEGENNGNQNGQGGQSGQDGQSGQNGQDGQSGQGNQNGQSQNGNGQGKNKQPGDPAGGGQGKNGEGENNGGSSSGSGGQGDKRNLGDTGNENNTKDKAVKVKISKNWGANDMISKEDAMKIAEDEGDPYNGNEINQSPTEHAKEGIRRHEKEIRDIGKGTNAPMDRILDNISAALKPPVANWKAILKKHLRSAGDKRQVFKMDKRRIPQDRADWAEEEMPKNEILNNAADVFYLVDASGSISDRDLYRVFSEIVGNKGMGGIECSKGMTIRKSAFTYFADRVVDSCIRVWTVDDTRARKMKLIARTNADSACGGGTDIEGSVLHVLKLPKKFYSKNNPKTVLIVFTDGEDYSFNNIKKLSPSIKKEIIFCIMNSGSRVQERCNEIAKTGIPAKNIIGIDTENI